MRAGCPRMPTANCVPITVTDADARWHLGPLARACDGEQVRSQECVAVPEEQRCSHTSYSGIFRGPDKAAMAPDSVLYTRNIIIVAITYAKRRPLTMGSMIV